MVFHKTPNLDLLIERACFLRKLVPGIYPGNCIRNGNLRRNPVNARYVQENIYFELLVSLSILFEQIFIHTIEFACSTQVGVEPVLEYFWWCLNG